MKNLLSKKDHQRRYYLHSRIKKNYATDAYKRQVCVPASDIDEASANRFIMELCTRFGYNIQTTIT